MTDLTVVVPAFNEEAGIERCIDRLRAGLERTGYRFELVCVDDGSRDRTAGILERLAARDTRVRWLSLSRNFGKEAALAAGLAAAHGRAVLIVDADLQHPAELIPDMVRLWEQGYEVVNGVKVRRGNETWLYRAMAGGFNWLMGSAVGSNFQGASDYKLLDRQAVDALLACPEQGRFFRGLVAWVGFRVAEVRYDVAARAGGGRRWSLRDLVRYSVRNLVAFSIFPLRLVAAAGFITLLFAGGLSLWTLYRYLNGTSLSGFTTVILLQLLLGGLLLVSISVIALYLSAIYEETKRRPIYLIRTPRPPAASPGAGDGTER